MGVAHHLHKERHTLSLASEACKHERCLTLDVELVDDKALYAFVIQARRPGQLPTTGQRFSQEADVGFQGFVQSL